MLTELGSAIYVAGLLIAGDHDSVPVQDRNICVIERPVAVAPHKNTDYEIWIFESAVKVCPKRKRRYAGPTDSNEETVKGILIGGTGGK